MEAIERFTQEHTRKINQTLKARILDRVATTLIPRPYLLLLRAPNERDVVCPIHKWKLCRGKTWGDLFTVELEYGIVLKLDNPFSPTSVFACKYESGLTLKWISYTPDPPKDSLQFLAARALAQSWDKYDEETQQLICNTVAGL
jgi:hypothetical protein